MRIVSQETRIPNSSKTNIDIDTDEDDEDDDTTNDINTDNDNDSNTNLDSSSEGESGDEEKASTPPNQRETDTMKDARRLFVWSDRQLQLMAELHAQLQADGDEVDDESHVEMMLALCGSFILVTFPASEFTCGLVHFVAILGIDGENNRLRRQSDFTYMLAGMVYCVRVLAAEILLPSGQRDEQAKDPSRREHFRERGARYLTDGTSTPMSTMILLLAYGKHIAMNEGNAGAVSWS
jgi:hypothetical protein